VIVLGVDPHKQTHTIVAVDGLGRPLAELTLAARTLDHRRAVAWADALDPQHRWAVEDCRHVSGRLERDLREAGQEVVRVPPKLMAARRRSARSYGKSDPIDALAVARAALEHPDLPEATDDEANGELRLLVRYRDDLVGERTRHQNRLRWQLHDLAPELEIPARSLDRTSVCDRLGGRLRRLPQSVLVRICRNLLRRIRGLTREIEALAAELEARVSAKAPQLLALPGCGPLTAAKLLAEVGTATRFRTPAQFAMHCGVAPLEASSGRQQRHRLNRYGNRQLNAALYRIAITQIRVHTPAQQLYQRKQAEGKTRREALRVLKYHLARRVFRLLSMPTPPTLT
jgi:transposase